MKEHPIRFLDFEVRAILEGRKTQTRREMTKSRSICDSCRWEDLDWSRTFIDDSYAPLGMLKAGGPDNTVHRVWSRWRVGERLWVRETFIDGWPADGGDIQQFDADGNELPRHVWYRADYDAAQKGWISNRGALIQGWTNDDGWYTDGIPWKPSIHMPRWASRITLEITEIRVQRLQEISEEDAIAEGIGHCDVDAAIADYASLWDRINGPGAWESNPWVWAITFKRLPQDAATGGKA